MTVSVISTSFVQPHARRVVNNAYMYSSATRVQECRALLRQIRPAWFAGRGNEAWQLLDRARQYRSASPPLPLEIMAAHATLALLAERFTESREVALLCIESG